MVLSDCSLRQLENSVHACQLSEQHYALLCERTRFASVQQELRNGVHCALISASLHVGYFCVAAELRSAFLAALGVCSVAASSGLLRTLRATLLAFREAQDALEETIREAREHMASALAGNLLLRATVAEHGVEYSDLQCPAGRCMDDEFPGEDLHPSS